MTFSIVAHDPATGSWGIAVASKFLAVGALVPWGRAEAGAVATQALPNLSYGPDGLELLSAGVSAEETVARLTRADPERERRQLGVVDGSGLAANYTGTSCFDWAGGKADGEIAVQGNILVGPEVVEAMIDAYRGAAGRDFARRLLSALVAGDEAGGDRRGREAASLRVWRAGAAYGGVLDLAVDLRVDNHRSPTGELARLLDLHELYFSPPDPQALLDLRGDVAAEVASALAALGHDPASAGDLDAAIAAWAGLENLEERLVPGKIDPTVLAFLRDRAQTGGDD